MATRVGMLGLLTLLLAAPATTAQLHKDTRLGFQFKPPKGFSALALPPSERIVVAKYQSEQRESGVTLGVYASPMFQVSYYPTPADSKDGGARVEQIWELLETIYGYSEVTRSAKLRVNRVDGEERHIVPDKGYETIYSALLPEEDGIFVFTGTALKERFDKYDSDFSKATKSFKRIEKEDRSARESELEQMDSQERFLAEQIEKLPPGWSHLRTEHYQFLFNADKNWVKGLAKQIEAIREVFLKLYPPREPITAVSIVRVCANRDEYMGYGGSAGSGGYWNAGQRELVFFDAPPRVDNESVLNHEAFHQYIYYFYGELAPASWYNEGTGDYFSGARMTKTYRVTEFASAPGGYNRLGAVKEACRLLRAGETDSPQVATPLKQLLSYSQSDYYARGGVHYPQGWALVHMLRESKRLKPKWEAILDDYLVSLLEAREELAKAAMLEAMDQAERKEPGSSAELPTEITKWYPKAVTGEVQDLAYKKTFAEWTDADWDEFNEAYLDYVEKL